MLILYKWVCHGKSAGDTTLIELDQYFPEYAGIAGTVEKASSVPQHIGEAAVYRANFHAVVEILGALFHVFDKGEVEPEMSEKIGNVIFYLHDIDRPFGEFVLYYYKLFALPCQGGADYSNNWGYCPCGLWIKTVDIGGKLL